MKKKIEWMNFKEDEREKFKEEEDKNNPNNNNYYKTLKNM